MRILITLIAALCTTSISLGQQSLEQAIAWQISLERAGFSPGVIDGKIGGKTHLATEYFQRYRGLEPSGELDAATAAALGIPELAISEYTVSPSDLAGHAPLTTDWNERAAMQSMGYYDLLDALAERFHASKGLMQSLNPGVDFQQLQAGTAIRAPLVLESNDAKAASLQIDLSRKLIMPVDSGGKVMAMFHCSIAANVEKRPAGETTIVTVIRDPNYTFDPVAWPEVKNVKGRLLIPPGPRNPVGMAWIGLKLPGYGIHGTPQPEMIGKSGSHGCFRMTNWDAVRLTRMVSQGMRVEFIKPAR